MRTIIAGSRDCSDYTEVLSAIQTCGWVPSVVLSGAARGADRLGEAWAQRNSIPVELYPAYWDVHGKSAGYKRNALMAENAEALIALWDGRSRGTKHMIDLALAKGLRVSIHFTQAFTDEL